MMELKVIYIGLVLCVCFFHAVAMLWATIFFYKTGVDNRSRLFVWSSLVLEWIDMVFMCVVIILLNHITAGCFTLSICKGYFSVMTIL